MLIICKLFMFLRGCQGYELHFRILEVSRSLLPLLLLGLKGGYLLQHWFANLPFLLQLDLNLFKLRFGWYCSVSCCSRYIGHGTNASSIIGEPVATLAAAPHTGSWRQNGDHAHVITVPGRLGCRLWYSGYHWLSLLRTIVTALVHGCVSICGSAWQEVIASSLVHWIENLFLELSSTILFR